MTISTLITNGKPEYTIADKEYMMDFFARHEGKKVYVTFDFRRPTRGVQANRYYWGVVLQWIADETGHTPEDLHELFKSKFAPRSFVTVGRIEEEIAKSTTTLDTKQFSEYVESVRSFAASELGIRIPSPNEI